jgi:hypothetical protein
LDRSNTGNAGLKPTPFGAQVQAYIRRLCGWNPSRGPIPAKGIRPDIWKEWPDSESERSNAVRYSRNVSLQIVCSQVCTLVSAYGKCVSIYDVLTFQRSSPTLLNYSELHRACTKLIVSHFVYIL